jgi:hypothetical protein
MRLALLINALIVVICTHATAAPLSLLPPSEFSAFNTGSLQEILQAYPADTRVLSELEFSETAPTPAGSPINSTFPNEPDRVRVPAGTRASGQAEHNGRIHADRRRHVESKHVAGDAKEKTETGHECPPQPGLKINSER